MDEGALVLKLLRIKRPPRSIFRPTTEGSETGTSLAFGLRSLARVANGAKSMFQQAQSLGMGRSSHAAL